jgi:hypothetical protein
VILRVLSPIWLLLACQKGVRGDLPDNSVQQIYDLFGQALTRTQENLFLLEGRINSYRE